MYKLALFAAKCRLPVAISYLTGDLGSLAIYASLADSTQYRHVTQHLLISCVAHKGIKHSLRSTYGELSLLCVYRTSMSSHQTLTTPSVCLDEIVVLLKTQLAGPGFSLSGFCTVPTTATTWRKETQLQGGVSEKVNRWERSLGHCQLAWTVTDLIWDAEELFPRHLFSSS